MGVYATAGWCGRAFVPVDRCKIVNGKPVVIPLAEWKANRAAKAEAAKKAKEAAEASKGAKAVKGEEPTKSSLEAAQKATDKGSASATNSDAPAPASSKNSSGVEDTVSISSQAAAAAAKETKPAAAAPAPTPASAPTKTYGCTYTGDELAELRLFGATPKPDAAERSKAMLKACAHGALDNTLEATTAASIGARKYGLAGAAIGGGAMLSVGCYKGMQSKHNHDLLNPHSTKEALDSCNKYCALQAKKGNFQHPDCEEVK